MCFQTGKGSEVLLNFRQISQHHGHGHDVICAAEVEH